LNGYVTDRLEDMAAEVARGAARRLAPEFGERIEMDVEAALSGGAQQYDPVSVGILVVAIATLAWEVYAKRRERKEAPELLERAIRTEVRREFEMTPQSMRVTEVVIKEIVDRSNGS
jgi:hypothetical protein